MSNSGAEASSVQAVERALTILDLLARSGEAGVTKLAADIGVHKSTAFRLVTTLERGGLVEQSEHRGKYRLGMGILRLAGATTARLDVVQEARAICRKLAAATGETVNISVLSDRSALYLDQVAGPSSLQPHNWVGQHIPLHATSNGKVLLSGLSAEEIAALVPGLPALTDRTITDISKLQAEVDEVRVRGYAQAIDELEVGLTAIAAPIRNAHGDVIAALSVSGPSFRLDRARIGEVLPLLQDAAREVSHRLGWSAI
jgi:DNA-binding IclR family transcriptional regulator